MKTESYNPSPLEVEFAKAIVGLKKEIEGHLTANKIQKIENNISADNPAVIYHLVDSDGDKHVVVVKLIQRIDRD
jgi:hypothetical protein